MSSRANEPPADDATIDSDGGSTILINAEEYPALAELVDYANKVTMSLEGLGVSLDEDDTVAPDGMQAGACTDGVPLRNGPSLQPSRDRRNRRGNYRRRSHGHRKRHLVCWVRGFDRHNDRRETRACRVQGAPGRRGGGEEASSRRGPHPRGTRPAASCGYPPRRRRRLLTAAAHTTRVTGDRPRHRDPKRNSTSAPGLAPRDL